MSLTGEALTKAEKHCSELWRKMLDFFAGYDLLILPTENNGKSMESYIDWITLNYAFSVAGLPAVSIPCGLFIFLAI